jgi:hypothetical protein
MTELTIIDELKTLLPPLSNEEYTGLEADILEHGCLSPMITWNGILVDGHHRYEICTKHEIPFSVQNIVFDNLDAAKLWAWKHQEHRRNLTPFHRAELALKLKDTIATKAKERQKGGQGGVLLPATLPEAKETRQELADLAGIGSRTLDKAEYIVENADEETKDKLRRGEKGTSINREFNRLRQEEKETASETTTAKPVPISDEQTENANTYPEPPCPNKHVKYFPKTTLKLIPQESPHVLLVNLFEIFRKGFVEEMVVMAMEMLAEERGKDVVKQLLAQLNKKHSKK